MMQKHVSLRFVCNPWIKAVVLSVLWLLFLPLQSNYAQEDWGALSNSTIHIVLGSHQDLGWENAIPWCTEIRDTMIITPVLGWMEAAWTNRRPAGPHGDYIDYSYSMEHMLCLREYLERHPDSNTLSTIQQFTGAGQFEWGATYNCPYESLLSSEGLVRQVYLGRKWLKNTLGTNCDTRSAWNPDVPARAIQMPQILKKAGIDYLIISRIDSGFVEWNSPDEESHVLVFSDGHYAQPWLYNDKGLLHPYAYTKKVEWSLPPTNQPADLGNVITNIHQYWTTPQGIGWRDWRGHETMAEAWENYLADTNYNLPPILPILYTIDMGKPPPWLGVTNALTQTNNYSYHSDLILDWKNQGDLPNLRMSTGEYMMDAITNAAGQKGSSFKQWTGERPNVWLYIHGPSHHYAVTAMREAGRLLPAAETFATIDALLAGDFSAYPSDDLMTGWEGAIYPDVGWGGKEGESTDSNFLEHARSGQLLGEQVLHRSLTSTAGRIEYTRSNATPIVAFNTLAWKRTDPVIFTVKPYSNTWSIVDASGQAVAHQVLRTGATVTNIVTDEIQTNMTELVFMASDVPSLGYKTYYLVDEQHTITPPAVLLEPTHYSNAYYDVHFAPGGMERLYDLTLNREIFNTTNVYGNALFQTTLLGGELFMMYSDGQGAGEWLEIQQPYPNIFFRKVSDMAGAWTNTESGPVRDVYEFTVPVSEVLEYPESAWNDQYISGQTQTLIQCSVRERLIFYRDLKRIDCEISILDWNGALYVEWRMALPTALAKGEITYEVPMGTVQVGRDEISGPAGAAYSSQDCKMIHPREVQNFISVCDSNESFGVTLSSDVAVCDYYFAANLMNVYSPSGGEQWTNGQTFHINWTPLRTTTETTSYNALNIDLYKNNAFYLRIATNQANTAVVSSGNGNGAFDWLIPTHIPPGNDYKIMLSSGEDENIKFALSRADFSIASSTFSTSTAPVPATLYNEHGPDNNGLIKNPVLQPVLLATRTSCNGNGNPYSQNGDHHYRFSILSHTGNWNSTDHVAQQSGRRFATQANSPLVPIIGVTSLPQAVLPPQYSFCSVSPDNIVLTAFKKRDHDDASPSGIDTNIILRIYDIKGEDTQARIDFFFAAKDAHKTSLIEELLDQVPEPEKPVLSSTKRSLDLLVGHHSIETIQLESPGGEYLWTITGTPGPDGNITPSGVVVVAQGTSNSFNMLPDTYYHVTNVYIDSIAVGATNSYSFVSVMTNHIIQALFGENLATNAVPEWWLAQYGWTNNFDTEATNDPDNDSVPTWAEFYGDTNPTNPASYFHISSISSGPPTVLHFTSSSQRYYSLVSSEDLIGGTWSNVSGQVNIQGTGGLDSLQDALSQTNHFYHLEVNIAP